MRVFTSPFPVQSANNVYTNKNSAPKDPNRREFSSSQRNDFRRFDFRKVTDSKLAKNPIVRRVAYTALGSLLAGAYVIDVVVDTISPS